MTSIPAAICRIFCNNCKRCYLKNGTLFLDILLHFWNVHEILNSLKKRMSVLDELFRELLFPKEVATETSRRSCFRTPFCNQRVNEFQTPLKVTRHHCYPFPPQIPGKLSWKKTALHWSKILRRFANTLTDDDKDSCRNMENFLQQVQRLLSQKRKTFSGFFIAFLKCAWNLEHFEKKDRCPSLIFSVKYFPKEVATETSRRSCFRTPFGNQRVNAFQTPLKVTRHYYYNFLPWIPGKLSWKKTALLWS